MYRYQSLISIIRQFVRNGISYSFLSTSLVRSFLAQTVPEMRALKRWTDAYDPDPYNPPDYNDLYVRFQKRLFI